MNKRAFPSQGYNDGMDLRDYFAAKIIDYAIRDVCFSIIDNDEDIAEATKFAYRVADAMIKEREKK